jgi:hypothetical protein
MGLDGALAAAALVTVSPGVARANVAPIGVRGLRFELEA